MPPKEVPKTKQELAKLAKEQKRIEEEARVEAERLKAIKDEEDRIEQERLRKLLEAKLKKEELARLNQEYETIGKDFVTEYKGKIYQASQQIKAKADWQEFTECSILPNPRNLVDLSTFQTQYNESQPVNSLESIDYTLNQIQISENIISELIAIQTRDQVSKVNSNLKEFRENFVSTIRKISVVKFEQISSFIAQNFDLILEEKESQRKAAESQNNKNTAFKQDDKSKQEVFKMYSQFNDIKYGMWLNPVQKGGFYRMKPIDFIDLGIQVEVPRNLVNQSLLMKVLWTQYDNYTTNNQLGKDQIVGGVLDIELFEFLQQAKKANGWTIKYQYEPKDALKKVNYPALDSSGQMNLQNVSPISIFYQLASHVYVQNQSDIRIALYDKKQGWTSENIEDIRYEQDKKLISFKTIRLAPFAFIQHRCTDYPYQSWKLRCISDNVAIVDIVGRRLTLRFEIGDNYAILRTDDQPQLKHLQDKKMPVSYLLSELEKSGINIQPQDQDAHYAKIQLKDEATEENCLQDISLAVRGYFIKSSKWNQDVDSEQLIIRLRENMEYDQEFAEDQEKGLQYILSTQFLNNFFVIIEQDWKSFIWWKNKCAVVKARDSHPKVDTGFLMDSETHLHLPILLKQHQVTTADVVERIQDLEYVVFADTLKRFLKITRLVSFTTGPIKIPSDEPQNDEQQEQENAPQEEQQQQQQQN